MALVKRRAICSELTHALRANSTRSVGMAVAAERVNAREPGAREFCAMYFNQDDDERDPFELFGDEVAGDSRGDIALQEFENTAEEPAVIEPQQPAKVKTGFSWAGFAGGLSPILGNKTF